MTVNLKRKEWRGQCAYCGHYELRHGTPCQGSDDIGSCLCQKWVEVYTE